MICQQCQQRFAKIHLKHSINGKHTELYLCESCARNANELQMNSPLFMKDFLGGLLSQIQSSSGTSTQRIQCNRCQMTFEDFQKSGRIGCGHCYEVFLSKLDPIIRRLHGNVTYVGQYSSEHASKKSETNTIQDLQKKIKEAVQKEDYELAAKLRDKIKDLQQKERKQMMQEGGG